MCTTSSRTRQLEGNLLYLETGVITAAHDNNDPVGRQELGYHANGGEWKGKMVLPDSRYTTMNYRIKSNTAGYH